MGLFNVDTETGPAGEALCLSGVTVVRSGVTILDGIGFAVARGEKVIVAGENGAGKTTLLKSILGLVPVSEGLITVLGRVVGSRGWRALRRIVGYVNQESVQVDFPISALEVAEIGMATRRCPRRERRERARHAMRATGTAQLSGRDYRVLSGGEKQRVSIARCLAQQASILLFDEPGAFLDSQSRREIVRIIDELNDREGISVVLVTHQPDEIESDGWRRIDLRNGRMLLETRD